MKKIVMTAILTLALAGNVMAKTDHDNSMYNQYDVLNMPINNSNTEYALPLKAMEFDIDGEPVMILTDFYGNTFVTEEELENGGNYVVFFDGQNKITEIKKSDYSFTYEKEFLYDDNIVRARAKAIDLILKNNIDR